MWNVSREFHEAFKSDYRKIYARITINGKVYRNNNLTSVNYDGGSIVGDSFSIGSTFSNSARIVFCEIIEGIKELDEVKIDFGIEYLKRSNCSNGNCDCRDGEFLEHLCNCQHGHCDCQIINGETWCPVVEFCPMGVFLISEAVDHNRNENRTTIECMDRMILLEGEYVSNLTYPAQIREVALEIANLAGLEVDVTSFGRLSANPIERPEGYSFRQAIGLIAQFEAGFVTLNRRGLLAIRRLEDPNFIITPSEYFQNGLVKNELKYQLGGIQAIIRTELEDNTLRAGSSAGSQIVLENNVMTQFLLDNIFNQLRDLSYYPFTLNWRGNPALETGDWVEMFDREGNRFFSPNLSYRLNFNGGLTAVSSADTQSQPVTIFQRRNPLHQHIDWLNGIIGANGNATFFGSAIPQSPREGDIWFRTNGPDTEILVFQNGEWVLQLSSAISQEIRDAIEQAQEAAQEAVESANSAVSEAYDALQQANSAFDKANDAFNQASDAVGQIEGVRQTVDDAYGNSSEALQLVEGFRQTVDDAYGNSTLALQTAQGVQTIVTGENGLSSQVTQLSNQWSVFINDEIDDMVTSIIAESGMIDLRISESLEDGGVVSSFINVSMENIVLSGNQIILDGQTIVRGEFTVQDANIGSLSADKLTVGSTLNAADVNVINLNASNLVSGVINSDRIGSNTIQARHITISDFTNFATADPRNPDSLIDGSTGSWQGQQWIFNGHATNAGWHAIRLGRYYTAPFAVGDQFNVKITGFRLPPTSGTPFTTWRCIIRYSYTDGWVNASTGPTVSLPQWSAEAREFDWDLTINTALDVSRTLSHVDFFVESGSSGTGTLHIRNIQIKRKVGGSLIVHGSITADHIRSGAITAGMITTGTLSADRVRGGTFRTDGTGGSFLTMENGRMTIFEDNVEGAIVSHASMQFRDPWRGSAVVGNFGRSRQPNTTNVLGVFMNARINYTATLGAQMGGAAGNFTNRLSINGSTGVMRVLGVQLGDRIDANGQGANGAWTFGGSGRVRIDTGKIFETGVIHSLGGNNNQRITVSAMTSDGVQGLALQNGNGGLLFLSDGRVMIQRQGTWNWL